MNTNATKTAKEQGLDLENEIAKLRRGRAATQSAAPKSSPLDLARAHLGLSNVKPPSAADIAKAQDELNRIDGTIDGLVQLRIELEPKIVREEIAMLEEREANDHDVDLSQKIADAEKTLHDLDAEQRGRVNRNAQFLRQRAEKQDALRGMADSPQYSSRLGELKQRLARLGDETE
jgi:hypothetical protein